MWSSVILPVCIKVDSRIACLYVKFYVHAYVNIMPLATISTEFTFSNQVSSDAACLLLEHPERRHLNTPNPSFAKFIGCRQQPQRRFVGNRPLSLHQVRAFSRQFTIFSPSFIRLYLLCCWSICLFNLAVLTNAYIQLFIKKTVDQSLTR